ncbi:MAG: hypothetical protein V1827_04260 [Candidatus Micrarchaeota archaeon]
MTESNRPRVRMMDLLVVARRYTNAKDSEIIAALRGHLGSPLLDEERYFTRTAKTKAGIERWTRINLEAGRGKAALDCFREELNTFFNYHPPQVYNKAMSKIDGHSSTAGWENRKGGN